jgi:hypothetical protein
MSLKRRMGKKLRMKKIMNKKKEIWRKLIPAQKKAMAIVKNSNSNGTLKTLKSSSKNKHLPTKTLNPKRPNPFTRKNPNPLKPKTKSPCPNLPTSRKVAPIMKSLRNKTRMDLLT